jgi:hypothetical protein
MRMVKILTVVFLLLYMSSAVAQEPFWARCLPGPQREVWLYGRSLWVGPEKVTAVAQATIEGDGGTYPLRFDHHHGANDQDANRGLPYLQRFIVPPEARSGIYRLRHTRNDGRTSESPVNIPERESSRYLLCTHVTPLSQPLIVKAGTTYDGDGEVLMPADDFPIGKPLVVMETNSRLQCVHVICPEFTAPSQAISVQSPSDNILISHVKVYANGANRIGLFLRGARNAILDHVTICASRCVDANPADQPENNSFIDCQFSSPRGSADGQIGRGIGGRANLYLRCRWSDIDRGPTLSPQGYPIDRSVWFECEQESTGITQGASEGLLIESKKLAFAQCQPIGRMALLIFTHDAKDYAKPGYFVFVRERDAWARIVSAELQAGTNDRGWRVTLDRDLGAIPGTAYVGNAAVENAFIRCRFWNGKSGIWLWGASQSNVITNCDFRDLDFGILTMDRNNPPGDVGFSRGLITTHNRYRRVGEEGRVMR